jgi:hypothetical protein
MLARLRQTGIEEKESLTVRAAAVAAGERAA